MDIPVLKWFSCISVIGLYFSAMIQCAHHYVSNDAIASGNHPAGGQDVYTTAEKYHNRCYDCSYHYAKGGYHACQYPSPKDGTDKWKCDGRCFIRRDFNGHVYRGCGSKKNFPYLDSNQQGCSHQGHPKTLWWFCDGDLCNGGDLMKLCGAQYYPEPGYFNSDLPNPSQAVHLLRQDSQVKYDATPNSGRGWPYGQYPGQAQKTNSQYGYNEAKSVGEFIPADQPQYEDSQYGSDRHYEDHDDNNEIEHVHAERQGLDLNKICVPYCRKMSRKSYYRGRK